MSNIFGGNTGLTYEQVRQRQRVADQLRSANTTTPRNAGEGIHALARGLVARATDRQAKREEDRINSEWQEQVSGMGLDPQRAAIYSQLDHSQRAGAVLSHLDRQDAERRAAAARGAAASKRAAEEQRALAARMAIAQALQGRTVPNGQPMGPTVAAANAGAQSGADLAALQTTRQAPTQDSVVQALIGNPNVPLGMIDNAVGMLPEAPKARETQFVKGIGLIDSQTGDVVNDFGGSAGGEAQAEYGLTPQYGTRADGTLTMIQLSKDGTAKEVDLPEGIALQKGVEKLDLGTSFQWYNTITGDPIGAPIPKDIAGEASAAARGRAEGTAAVESAATTAEMQRNMSSLLTVVDQLEGLSDTATYTRAGRIRDELRKQAGLEPTEGAIARAEYIAVVDNQVLPLLRQTFGAAFTAKEGDTLRATLGDPDKSPAEKKAVLNAFIAQKKRDLEARGGTVPQSATPNPPAIGGPVATHRFNPATNQIEAIQ